MNAYPHLVLVLDFVDLESKSDSPAILPIWAPEDGPLPRLAFQVLWTNKSQREELFPSLDLGKTLGSP